MEFILGEKHLSKNKLFTELMKDGALKANGLVVSLILIASGIFMLFDHSAMSGKDIESFTTLGIVMLSGGCVCIGLELYNLRLSLKRSS